MKPNTSLLFSNVFDDERITSDYLARFADDVIAKLTQNSEHNNLDTALLPLQETMIPFRKELGLLDTSLNIQTGKTATVDGFIAVFSAYMKTNYVMIAAKLGGEKAPALLEFYPHKKTEYHNIPKTKMPTLLDRLHTVAQEYETELGAEISTQLQQFQSQWKLLREDQLDKIAAVKTNRIDRTLARRALETQLLFTIHFIGCLYPGNEDKCKLFFDFNLLFGAKHR